MTTPIADNLTRILKHRPLAAVQCPLFSEWGES